MILPSTSPVWLLCVPLAVLANIGFGASIVALNAYLPTLAQEAEDVVRCKNELRKHTESHLPTTLASELERPLDADADEAEDPLLPRAIGGEQADEHLASLNATYNATLSRTTSRISTLGIALGYLSGISLLLVALVPVTKLGGSTFSLRLAISMSGIWWAVFTLPAAIWLPSVSSIPSASAPEEWGDSSEQQSSSEEKWSMAKEIINAWKRLGAMLRWREIKKLRGTFQYLAAWFLLSDGFTTIISTAVLFGKVVLRMPPSSLILVSILAPTAGVLGSLVMPALQKRFGWSNVRVLVTLVILASLIPVYGCVGFLPIFQHSLKFGGLTTPGEMYGLAFFFVCTFSLPNAPRLNCYNLGLHIWCILWLLTSVLRGVDPARRGVQVVWSVFHHRQGTDLFLLHGGHRVNILSQTSSFVGPMVVGIIADATGNIRYGFFFVVVMVLASVPILLVIDVDRGRREAREYVYRVR